MSSTPTTGGPVSTFLEADLRTWVRRHGIVVWLDLDDHYTTFVDRLAAARAAGELPYEVQAFRGSHLELMLKLGPLVCGAERTPLVIHLPGFSEETVRTTPLLELYMAGARYRKKLDTLVTEAAAGRVRPEQIAAFRERGALSLDGADTWLAALLDEGSSDLSTQLGTMPPMAIIDDLLARGYVAGRTSDPGSLHAVWTRLEAATGLPEKWRTTALPPSPPTPEDVAFAASGWALCVEYTDDLKRSPVDPSLQMIHALPRPVVDMCHQLAAHLRDRHPAFYRRTADETEALLVAEVSEGQAEYLSGVDTFRFEEGRLLESALTALADGKWDAAAEWAGQRLRGGSFWLRDDPSRQAAWELVDGAARLGQAIAAAGPKLNTDHGLEAALQHYVELGVGVDQAHRHLEQRRGTLLQPQIPEFETLRARLDQGRCVWRSWADSWARAFNALCRREGFLPPAALQQRFIFEEVVRPLTQDGVTTAYFLIDAFRFEMGEELYRRLADTPATTVQLLPRLAELPTVTEVGMNALAPVAAVGKLQPALANGRIQGFSTGEFRVSDPETRKRAMHSRIGGGTCPWLSLEEVVSRDSTSLKRSVAQARLLVVHCQEIDAAGEQGVGPAVFDRVMQRLCAAWSLLRDAGVKRFVFTADHGFLLLDESAQAVQSHGRKIDPKRRHVFSTVAADHTGEVRVALSDLGYEGVDGQYLMFPETTAVFDTGKGAMSFVHGGNSLQERVIPVLTLVHRAPAGGSTLRYTISATAREDVAGMHCLEARVECAAQLALDFGSAREVELALRVPEAPGVQVEICQTRGGAGLSRGTVMAKVGESFELFFRLSGAADARVPVELYHPSARAEVTPYAPETRFAVAVSRTVPAAGTGSGTPKGAGRDWLFMLPEGGVRNLFTHLAEHGAVTEPEATTMLGGPRELRKFARQFDELSAKVPFSVHIDVVAGVKRYVREGSES